MEKASKRGKIPQSDWPLIMGRYEAGETLASIARTYDCSPPAISYIVSRSRARQPAGEAEPVPISAEPHLLKGQSGEVVPAVEPVSAPRAAAPVQPAAAEIRPATALPLERRGEERPRDSNGILRNGTGERSPATNGASQRPPMARPQAAPQSAGPFNGDHRRTLHLSLGGNGSNGHGPSGEGSAREFARPSTPAVEPERSASPQHQPQHQPPYGNGYREQTRFPPAAPERGHGDASARGDAEAARRKDGGTFIDQELRTRVDGDIAAFLAAFDAALAGDTQESRFALREATDRLLRAGARTRIELERLEARVPLTPRDTGGRAEPAWRQR